MLCKVMSVILKLKVVQAKVNIPSDGIDPRLVVIAEFEEFPNKVSFRLLLLNLE